MKRFSSSFLLCLFVLILLLAGCGGAQEAPPGTTPAPTETPASVRGVEGENSAETPEEAAPQKATATPRTAISTTADSFSTSFAPRPDGLGFRNYGASYPEGALTIAELRAQFGDDVCSRIDGERCVPTAAAVQWIADRTADMSAGHCIGFTVTSYRFMEDDLQPQAFTPAADVPFQIDQDVPIMRTIAANGALYWAQSVWSQEVSGTPSEVLEALLALGEPVDLSIFLPGLAGGHSLLAYGVEEVGPGQYHILVYDNNFPGTEAFVEVDTEADTWRYAHGAVNPDQAPLVYEGDAETQTLRFIPLSAYDMATCPFCAADEPQEDASEHTLLSFLGNGDVLVETALGRIGFVNGKFINEIPGASFIFPRGQLAGTGTPAIVLPGEVTDFAVQFNGLERVSTLNSALSVVVDQLTAVPEQSELAVDEAAQRMAFQAGGAQSPALVATSSQDTADYRVALLGVAFEDGQSVALSQAPDGSGLIVAGKDVDASEATLLITRLTDEGEAVFATTAVDSAQGDVRLDLAGWNGLDAMTITVDANADGSFEEQPQELSNEPPADVLGKANASQASAIAANLTPFMGEADLADIVAALPGRGLSGAALAQILRPLALGDAQLAAAIPPLELAAPELAELLFELRLEPARLQALLELLDLPAAEETAVRAALANLALYQEILAEWAFRGTGDLGVLAALLNEQGLSAAQLLGLLPRLGLSAADLGVLLGELDVTGAERAALAEALGVTLLAAPATRAPAVTATRRGGTFTPTPSPAPGGTATATPTVALPPTTATEAAYPGPEPLQTDVPGPYPAPDATNPPGGYPSETPEPGAYPAPAATATAVPEVKSFAFCSGDDLRVLAQEDGWLNTAVTIRADEGLLLEGQTGAAGEPFSATVSGPGTWTNLRIEAPVEPLLVALGTISCP